MKYKYLYQTKENENRSGWIRAKNRENAYALLRKQGIRPYRVIGDDPPVWRLPALIGGGLLAVGLGIFLLLSRQDAGALPRQQLAGNRAVIDAGVYSGWIDVLPSLLDRCLAAYAQPGRIAIPPEVDETDLTAFAGEVADDVVFISGEPPEHRLLKRILRRMRQDMRDYLAAGGTVGDYLTFLDERQNEEHEFREKAVDAVLRAPESMRERVLVGVNARLRDMSIEPVALDGVGE